jgi:hypothetical protein
MNVKCAKKYDDANKSDKQRMPKRIIKDISFYLDACLKE